ncbi:MAG: DJ-1/PfpI family protein [Candidatus Muiribacteriota bacterium]
MTQKNIYIVFANQLFRDEELKIPLGIFNKNNINSILTSNSLDMAVGKLGMHIEPELLYTDIDVKKADAIMFVGGPGTKFYFNDKKIHNILKNFNNKNKLIAAICISPVVLANAGLLKGKNATVWIDGKEDIQKSGANFIDKPVVIDSNIITANGPKAAREFAEKILKNI